MRTALLAAAVLLVAAGAVPVQADEASWQQLNSKANVLKRQGKYAEAIEMGKQSLQTAEQEFGPEHFNVAVALRNLGLAYTLKQEFWEAKPLLERAVDIAQKKVGQESFFVATLLADLADIYYVTKVDAKTEEMYKKSLQIREKLLGPDDLLVAQSLHGLARFYGRQQRTAEAEQLYKRALAIIRHNSPEHIYMPFFMKELAKIYSSEGNSALSNALIRRAAALESRLYQERTKGIKKQVAETANP